jgi:DNA repair exonuclease SbcCD ATPase subunit
MRPVYIYLEDFLCYDKTELNLSSLTHAMILGQKTDNDLFSNAVGKSSIFTAIQYVLFNEIKDGKLEELIRDDTNACRVTFDFVLDNKIWRITRKRTRKGSAELSLLERSAYEEDGVDPHSVDLPEDKFKLFWTDKSSRRAADTEADLEKLIKTNLKGFTSAFVFAQNDFTSGMANVTASKRRAIFKESLPMGIYSKLEKLVKDKSAQLVKEIEKKKTLRDNFGDLAANELKFALQLLNIQASANAKGQEIADQARVVAGLKENVDNLTVQHTALQTQMSSILDKKKSAEDRVNRTQSTVNDTSSKIKLVVTAAKTLAAELKDLNSKEAELIVTVAGLQTVEQIKQSIDDCQNKIAHNNAAIKNLDVDIEELAIPLPADANCKHCRQVLTDAHRRECQKFILEEAAEKAKEKEALLTDKSLTLKSLKVVEAQLVEVLTNQKNLEKCSAQIVIKQKEIADKRKLYDDYNSIIEKQKEELAVALQEFEQVKLEAEAANEEKLTELKSTLATATVSFKSSEKYLAALTQELNQLNGNISVAQHNIAANKQAIIDKATISDEMTLLEEEQNIYPDLIQSFSPTGIPNLIIQSLLDDLQIEANDILSKIKPELQLAFSVMKTKSDGEIDDDLDINYFVHGKPRSWALISGAQKLSVMFALKLGYAVLLKQLLGTEVKFLLLDEVDAPLDKASTDALADLIKLFSKDFMILVITHNDRLKEKLMSKIILVEQDQNMVSRAKIT